MLLVALLALGVIDAVSDSEEPLDTMSLDSMWSEDTAETELTNETAVSYPTELTNETDISEEPEFTNETDVSYETEFPNETQTEMPLTSESGSATTAMPTDTAMPTESESDFDKFWKTPGGLAVMVICGIVLVLFGLAIPIIIGCKRSAYRRSKSEESWHDPLRYSIDSELLDS